MSDIFRLLDLPAEVRTIIYSHLDDRAVFYYTDATSIHEYQKSGIYEHRRRLPERQILLNRVCKQIAAEIGGPPLLTVRIFQRLSLSKVATMVRLHRIDILSVQIWCHDFDWRNFLGGDVKHIEKLLPRVRQIILVCNSCACSQVQFERNICWGINVADYSVLDTIRVERDGRDRKMVLASSTAV